MKKIIAICAALVIFTTSTFIVTAAQNFTLRTSDFYLFYFNDSRAVDRISSTMSNSQISDEIGDFMNSFRPEEFQIYEDTGYDLQGIFSEQDSYNMMQIKRGLDISGLIGIVSLILSISLYVFLIKNDYKKTLRQRYTIGACLSVVVTAGFAALLSTNAGKLWIATKLNLQSYEESSRLLRLFDNDFFSMAVIFYIGLSLVIIVIVSYITYRLTRPPRIFY